SPRGTCARRSSATSAATGSETATRREARSRWQRLAQRPGSGLRRRESVARAMLWLAPLSPARRVASALAVLALLALNLACPEGPSGPPPTRFCQGAPESASVDALEVRAYPELGGQGLRMVAVDVTWIGSGAPACANAEVLLFDDAGTLV